jgi:hypothetical protein
MSKCGFCGKTQFELVDNTPSHSNFFYSFIQCASCHSVAGVVEAVNPIAVLDDIKKQLADIKAQIGA